MELKGGIGVRLLFFWMLSAGAATLFPFNFGATLEGQEQGSVFFLEGLARQDTLDVVLNLLLFVPLGALLHRERKHRFLRRSSIVTAAGAAGLVIALAVEYLQGFLATRDSSFVDVMSNTAGALLGAFGHRTWGARVEARIARWRASPAMLARVMAGFTVLALLTSGALQAQTRLSNWSLEYPLLIGNEQTGDRPWRGRIFVLELTDAATPLASVRRFSTGEPTVIPGRRVAAFDFSGSPPYRDAAGNLPSLDWTERHHESSASGISLPGQSWLQTEGPTAGMTRRLAESNAFTLRVLCATDDVSQDGPARIVSNSRDPGFRNFTLGQQGSDMVFRLRTPATGLNGSRPEVFVPGVFSNDHPREILVTYDGAALLATAARSDHVSSITLTPGSSLALAIASRDASVDLQADELDMWQLVYLAVLFVPPGMLVAVLAHERRRQLVFGVRWVLVFALLLEGTLALVSGRLFDWRNVAMTAVVGGVVLTVVAMTFSTTDVRPRGSALTLSRLTSAVPGPDAQI